MTSTGLDAHSRDTVMRFTVKLGGAAVLASFGRHYLPAMVAWVALYALLTAAFALYRHEKLIAENFNHWDETLWLAFFAVALTAVDRLL